MWGCADVQICREVYQQNKKPDFLQILAHALTRIAFFANQKCFLLKSGLKYKIKGFLRKFQF